MDDWAVDGSRPRNFRIPALGVTTMQDLLKYLSSAPVLLAGWMFLIAGILIEINRFYPDALAFSF
jgi:photosystem I subunit 9